MLIIGVAAILCVSSARMDSATVDEPAHVASGVIDISYGWLNFYRGQMPLMHSLTGTPLVLAGYKMPPSWRNTGEDEWAVGRRYIYRSGYDAHKLLLMARLPTIALYLLLCVAVYVFVVQETASPWCAVAACALTAFCPTLMAHGRLATVDGGVTVFMFVAVAALLRALTTASVPAALLGGMSLAAALLTKVSALILLPYFFAVCAGMVVFRVVQPARAGRVIAIVVITAVATFEIVMTAEISRAYAAAEYPATPLLLVPFLEMFRAARYVGDFYSHRHEIVQFLLGRFSRSGWPQYYVVAVLVKSTIPAIVLSAIAITVAVRRRSAVLFALLGFVVIFLAVASAGHLDLGIRYVLPIYPLLYAAAGIALRSATDRRLIVAVAVLICWHVAENLTTYPSYIAYFNELIGSKRNADRVLVDSNLDWGQDIRRLDQWCEQRGIRKITVHYFSGADVSYDMPFARPEVRWAPERAPLPNGYFAVSRHLYRLSRPFWGIDYESYLKAQHAEYVATIGQSMYVYRIRRPEAGGPTTQD